MTALTLLSLGGIRGLASWVATRSSRDSEALPGTRAGPDSPPLIMAAGVSRFRSPLGVLRLWQGRQLACRRGEHLRNGTPRCRDAGAGQSGSPWRWQREWRRGRRRRAVVNRNRGRSQGQDQGQSQGQGRGHESRGGGGREGGSWTGGSVADHSLGSAGGERQLRTTGCESDGGRNPGFGAFLGRFLGGFGGFPTFLGGGFGVQDGGGGHGVGGRFRLFRRG